MFNNLLFNTLVRSLVALIIVLLLMAFSFSLMMVILPKKQSYRLLKALNLVSKIIFVLYLLSFMQLIYVYNETEALNYFGFVMFIALIPTCLSIALFILEKDFQHLISSLTFILMSPLFAFVSSNAYSVTIIIGISLELVRQVYAFISHFFTDRFSSDYYVAKDSLDLIDEGLAIQGNGYSEFQNLKFQAIMDRLNINKYDKVQNIWNEIINKDNLTRTKYEGDDIYIISIDNDHICLKKQTAPNYFEIIAYLVNDEMNAKENIQKNFEVQKCQKQELENYIKNIKSIEKENLLIHTKNNFHNLFGQRATIIQCILNDYYKSDSLDIKLLKEKLNNTLVEVKQTTEVDFDFGIKNLINSFALAGFDICIDPAILKMNNLRNTAFIDIVRECATNSLSHAKASVLNVQLTDKQTILIHDDKHLKLESLKESTGLDSIRLNANNLNLKVQFLFKDGFAIKLFSEHK